MKAVHWTVASVLRELKSRGSNRNVEGMARYGIVAARAFGTSAPVLHGMSKSIGRNQQLSLRLWRTGVHNARILAIEQRSSDERNFVKKGVNWALRQIGKRSDVLHRKAMETAKKIGKLEFPSARWIAADALRELESPALRRRLKKNSG